MQKIYLLLLFFIHTITWGQEKTVVYQLNIMSDINSTVWIHTQNAFKMAQKDSADAMLIHMNTYGGEVVFADSIRTKILNSPIPVYMFVDNNAASAGALISIACDKIFMRPGANIGAATVVDGAGQKMPDKYQSYMRSTIRATAEAQGGDTIITANDTIIKWKRDPRIAEAMVDESIAIAGIIDTGKVLTFTTLEAIKYGFCDGSANNIKEVLHQLKITNYELITYEPTFYDGLKGFLTNPFFHGILILIIIGGIYFELQAPGFGFPIVLSLIAAVLYFAPLYIDGLAENWEILIFIIGIGLVAVELFVFPGFGVAGIAGIILIITGLTLSLLNNVDFDFSGVESDKITESLTVVLSSFVLLFIVMMAFGSQLVNSSAFQRITLNTVQNNNEGYVGVDMEMNLHIGAQAIASTDLRPAGKILIDNQLYDACAESGYIAKGSQLEVIGSTSGQLVVKSIKA